MVPRGHLHCSRNRWTGTSRYTSRCDLDVSPHKSYSLISKYAAKMGLKVLLFGWHDYTLLTSTTRFTLSRRDLPNAISPYPSAPMITLIPAARTPLKKYSLSAARKLSFVQLHMLTRLAPSSLPSQSTARSPSFQPQRIRRSRCGTCNST